MINIVERDYSFSLLVYKEEPLKNETSSNRRCPNEYIMVVSTCRGIIVVERENLVYFSVAPLEKNRRKSK